MKLRTSAVVLLGLVTLGWAGGAWPELDEADKELPPWIQYYNKLKGSPKLLPWQWNEASAEAIMALDSDMAGSSMFRG